jgi:putative flippase GtrA
MLPTHLLVRYGAFAALAAAANLGTQRMVLGLGSSTTLFATALVAGTGAGLLLKYFLDKRWIFRDPATGLRAHRDRFSRYTLMGLATTGLFWGTETASWLLWRREDLREMGALLGLGLGYVVKYQLDRRFVFAVPAQDD